jgi:hypothetical protein
MKNQKKKKKNPKYAFLERERERERERGHRGSRKSHTCISFSISFLPPAFLVIEFWELEACGSTEEFSPRQRPS